MPSRLEFCGYLQPPDVPPDPTGEEWRGQPGAPGIPGPAGPAGPPGVVTASGPLQTTPGPVGSGIWWTNGGVVMIS